MYLVEICLAALCGLFVLMTWKDSQRIRQVYGVIVVFFLSSALHLYTFRFGGMDKAYLLVLTIISINALYAFSKARANPMLSLRATAADIAFFLGFILIISSVDVISFYVGIELVSLSSILWMLVRAKEVQALEACMKYIFIQVIASVGMVFVLMLLVYLGHSMHVEDIMKAILPIAQSTGRMYIHVLVTVWIASIVIKMGLAPVHHFIADVYEASAPLVMGSIGILPRIALWAVLWRTREMYILHVILWTCLWGMCAIFSWLWGHAYALKQQRLMRLMAYAGVAQMGWVALAFSVGTDTAMMMALDFMIVYALAWLMWVGCVVFLTCNKREIWWLDELSGLCHMPGMAYWGFVLIICLTTMMGLPPVLGFWVKFGIIRLSSMPHYIVLSFVGMLASVIGALYYVNVIYYAVIKTQYQKIACDEVIGGVVTVGLGCVLMIMSLYPVIFLSA